MVPNIDVESSTTPLLTEDKAGALPGQVYPFRPLSTLELEEIKSMSVGPTTRSEN